ncbi:hypothetical protein LTR13_008202 [Exophiala sideris]|nr:hypothetical protein LTR13_008202 [Exophiala sideris]KAK5176414.1 hypothetical protein LTR44_011036 [Eurotiomycetes sp. CCFEE 6388]
MNRSIRSLHGFSVKKGIATTMTIFKRASPGACRFSHRCVGFMARECEKLVFYNDEMPDPPEVRRPRAPKPRKSKYQTQEEHEELVREYYVEKVLPTYVEAIKAAMARDIASTWLFQEDGDPSHEMRKEGLAKRIEKASNSMNHTHPAYSPDLNPIEVCYNISIQRAQKRIWETTEELKQIIQEEWDAVTLEQISARIAELPKRCAPKKKR